MTIVKVCAPQAGSRSIPVTGVPRSDSIRLGAGATTIKMTLNSSRLLMHGRRENLAERMNTPQQNPRWSRGNVTDSTGHLDLLRWLTI